MPIKTIGQSILRDIFRALYEFMVIKILKKIAISKLYFQITIVNDQTEGVSRNGVRREELLNKNYILYLFAVLHYCYSFFK